MVFLTASAYDGFVPREREGTGEETAFTSGSTGGLDKASATTLAFPSIYRISVVNSEITDN